MKQYTELTAFQSTNKPNILRRGTEAAV